PPPAAGCLERRHRARRLRAAAPVGGRARIGHSRDSSRARQRLRRLASMMRQALRERIAWAHPEWWALGFSAAAWLNLSTAALATASREHQHHMSRGLADWMVMAVAMMVPLTTDAIQMIAARSLWRRRH